MSLLKKLIGRINKSIGGGGEEYEEEDDLKKSEEDGDIFEEEDEEDEDMEKSLEDEEDEEEEEVADKVESGALLKALTREVELYRKEARRNHKVMGAAVKYLLKSTAKFAGVPAPRKGALSTLEKGMGGGYQGGAKHRQFTLTDKREVGAVLAKAVKDGELTILEAGSYDSQINKSLANPNFQITPSFAAFLKARGIK